MWPYKGTFRYTYKKDPEQHINCTAQDKRQIQIVIFFYFSMKTYAAGTH